MEARFTPTVIAELRRQVIEHNEALPAAIREAALTKLGTLKGLYKRYHNGANPHEHALRKIEEHLDRQRDIALAKAEGRDSRGRFTGGGGNTTPPPPAHRDPNDDPTAPKTQIIPETRYSVFGPPIAGAAGVGLGAAVGAGATLRNDSRLDRLQHRVVAAVGRRAGGGAGRLIGRPIVNAGIGVARSGVGLVNRTLKTSHTRPAYVSDAQARSVGRNLGEKVGRYASHGYAATTNTVPASAKLLAHIIPASRPRLRMAGRGLVGAAAGAVFPGLLMYAPGLHAAATQAGPYLDAAFPRKVRKMVGPLFDAPEVLAKQAELATLDLQKANLRAVAQVVAREARRFVRTLKPDVASHAVGAGATANAPILGSAEAVAAGKKLNASATRTAHDAAEGAYALHEEGQTKISRAGEARILARHTLGLGIGGAAAGGIGGAAARAGYEYFNPGQHPRDSHGRFRSKASSALAGVKIGGVLGTAAGIAAGIAAVRQGRGALLRQAIGHLGDAAERLHTEAETVARTNHARDYAKANKGKLQNFAPGQVLDKDAVKASLEQKAEAEWRNAGGAAMANPQKWYELQLDQGFDKAVGKQLHALAGVDANGKRVPLTDAAGNRVSANFLHQLDESKLNPAQKKIWDDLKARHESAREQISHIYVERKQAVSHFDAEVRNLTAEKGKLEQGQRDLPNWQREADQLIVAKAPLKDIRTFMKYRLDVELAPNIKRDDAVAQMKTALDEYEDKSTDRLDEIDRALKQAKGDHDEAMKGVQADLEEAQRIAVKNPFATGKKDLYFAAIPDRAEAIRAVREAASKDFVAASDAVAQVAKGHLNTLIATRQAALNAGVPKTGVMGRLFNEYAPVVAGTWQQARKDAAVLMEARSKELSGVPKAIDDFLKTNKDPKAAYATAKAVGAQARAKATAGFKWSLANYGKITTAIGAAAALGVLDLTNPLRPIKLKGMSLPKGTRLINDPMGSIERPERLIGVVFRDKQTNQEVFASGIHIRDGGKSYVAIPFGSTLDVVRNQIRNRNQNQPQQGGGGQQGPRAQPVPVANRSQLNTVIDQLRKDGHVKRVGPNGREFDEREGGNHAVPQENEVFDALYKKHLEPLDARGLPREEANDRPAPFWDSLKELFEAHGTQVLSRTRRVQFLVGTNRRRGIFANPGRVFAGDPANASQSDVTNQLIRQVGMHTPINADEYKQLHRAIWLVGNHYNLSDGEKQRVSDALEKHYTNSSAQEPPHGGAQAGGSRNRIITELADLRQHVVDTIPEAKRRPSWKSDQDVMDFVDRTYRNAVLQAQQAQPNASSDEIHNVAIAATRRRFDELAKAAPGGELRKFLKWGTPDGNEPHIATAPAVGRIAGAGQPKAFAPPKAPKPGGGLRVPGASHQANQATSYVGGQIAFDAAEAASHFIPGSGIAAAATRAALPSAAGLYNTTQIAPKIGSAVGNALGDNSPPVETPPGQMAVRAAGGLSGQIATMKLTHALTERAGQAAANHLAQTSVGRAASAAASKLGQTKVGQSIAGAASRAAARAEAPGLMSQLGSKIGGAARAVGSKVAPGFFERAGVRAGEALGTGAGEIAGTVAEPGGGTLGGAIAGKAIGGVVGGTAGWLTDEAIGALYRHLGAYHPSVANTAAKHLGVPAGTRQRHSSAIAGARFGGTP